MKNIILFIIAFFPILLFSQETKLHPSQILRSGAANGEAIVYDSLQQAYRPQPLPISGLQEITSNSTLSGNGTVGSPLGVNNANIAPIWANITNMPAGFADDIDNVNDADSDPTNEHQNLNLSGTSITITNGDNVDIGGTFATDNEVSTAISNITYYNKYTEEVFSNLTSGNTVTISSVPVSTNYAAWNITRGGLKQRIGAPTVDVSISGTAVTFNLRDFEDGETVIIQYPNQ